MAKPTDRPRGSWPGALAQLALLAAAAALGLSAAAWEHSADYTAPEALASPAACLEAGGNPQDCADPWRDMDRTGDYDDGR